MDKKWPYGVWTKVPNMEKYGFKSQHFHIQTKKRTKSEFKCQKFLKCQNELKEKKWEIFSKK